MIGASRFRSLRQRDLKVASATALLRNVLTLNILKIVQVSVQFLDEITEASLRLLQVIFRGHLCAISYS